jgi:co-chaperonin GroES (HSP10)
MEIKPLKKMVLIAEQAKERTTESGIFLGDRGTGDMAKATVLAIGDEVTEVKVGDVILPEWAKCSVVKVDGAQRAMIKEEHIIAVVE